MSIFKKLFGGSDDEDESDQQLWIMIKENDFFRSDEHLSIVDDIAELLENDGLGELDGHSSGAHQFEINFFEVTNFEKAKSVVVDYFNSNHPEIEYTISNDYETTYESP
jgi:hypothetical protein